MLMWLRTAIAEEHCSQARLDPKVNLEPSKEKKNQERTTVLDMRYKEGTFFFKREWTLSASTYN